MSRELTAIFEEEDLRLLWHVYYALDAIGSLAARDIECNPRNIAAVAELAQQQLGGLLTLKPIGAGWDAIADAIGLPGMAAAYGGDDFDALYQPVPLGKRPGKRKRKKRKS